MTDSIIIEYITDRDGYRACQRLETEVWGHEVEVVPMYLFQNMVSMGGVVVGARDPQSGELVGCGFGFIARAEGERVTWMEDNPYFIYSEMLGVLPEYRNHKLGYRMKLLQREFALDKRYGLISWTFDPLLSRNANLNLNRLGGIARTYKNDYYGEMGGINAGLPTDRFECEWWVSSEHVDARLNHKHLRRTYEEWESAMAYVVEASYDIPDGFPVPVDPDDVEMTRHTVLVEIPPDFDAIKAADMDLALYWRLSFRKIARRLLDSGYIAADFVSNKIDGQRRSFYIFQRDFDMLKMMSPK